MQSGLFDGMARTIKLPHHKCTKLLLELKISTSSQNYRSSDHDHCHPVRHTNPWPTQLVHVIGIQTPRSKASCHQRAQGYPPQLVSTKLVGGRPTHVTELVEHQPAYQGFIDASIWGVGEGYCLEGGNK
jgi:hypothetical protein